MKRLILYCIIICLPVLAGYGCTKSLVNPAGMPQLFIPTAFTPNGDGHNDTFTVKCPVTLTYYHMAIYDNNNILVYQGGDINHGGWTGNYEGQPEPNGSYMWIIKCQTEGSPVYTSSGYVQLIR